MGAPSERRWVRANLFSDADYVEIVPPSAGHQERVRARLKVWGRLLVVLGVIATIFFYGPGLVAAVVLNHPTPAIISALIVVAVWAAGVVAWRAFVRWHVRRPLRINISAADYRRQRQQELNRRVARAPRTRIVDGLEYPDPE